MSYTLSLQIVILIVNTTLVLYGIYSIYIQLKCWQTIQLTKYRKVGFTFLINTSLFLVLNNLLPYHFFPKISSFMHTMSEVFEITLCYYIVKITSTSPGHVKMIRNLSALTFIPIIFSAGLSPLDPKHEFLYLYVSLIFTYSSIHYFNQLASKSSRINLTTQYDVLLQLAVFACNAVPMVSSICQIGIYLVDPSYNSRVLSKESFTNLTMPIVLFIVLTFSYTCHIYFITKAIKWITKDYTQQ